jgi:hypothetical protein
MKTFPIDPLPLVPAFLAQTSAPNKFQAMEVLGWLFTLGLAGAVWQGIKHAQKAYRAQDKQDKLEEAAWAIGIPAISAAVYWFSIKIGIINGNLAIGTLPEW